MKSDLCLHLGLCAQSSENCLEGTTAGVDTLFRGHEHSGRARDENQSDPCRRWKQSGDSLGEVGSNNFLLGTIVDWLSNDNRGQRDVHFKSSDSHSQLLISAQGFVSVFRRTGSAHLAEYASKVLLGFEAAGDGNIQDAHFGRT